MLEAGDFGGPCLSVDGAPLGPDADLEDLELTLRQLAFLSLG